MPLADFEIEELAKKGMITPFFGERLSPFGYDLSLATSFLVPLPNMLESSYLDPLGNNKELFGTRTGMDHIVVPPNSFVLGMSVERLVMPKDIVGVCLGRSSYARCGIISNVTPLEAGWEGVVTIEIANLGPWPVKVYASKGIVQVQFVRGNTPLRDYVSKGGRYQGQTGITLSRGV